MTARSTSPTTYGLCRFCLRGDVALTREHVFARWLIARLRAWRVTYEARDLSGAVAHPRVADLVAQVCGPCNAGWMSGLEVSFRQAVFARSRPERLDAPARRVLSRWFTKTAVLVACAAGQELIPNDQWPQLTTAMPAGVRVGLSRLRRPRHPLGLGLAHAPARADGEAPLAAVAVQVDDLVGVVTRSPVTKPATTLWPIRSHLMRWTTLPVVNRLSDLTGG